MKFSEICKNWAAKIEKDDFEIEKLEIEITLDIANTIRCPMAEAWGFATDWQFKCHECRKLGGNLWSLSHYNDKNTTIDKKSIMMVLDWKKQLAKYGDSYKVIKANLIKAIEDHWNEKHVNNK